MAKQLEINEVERIAELSKLSFSEIEKQNILEQMNKMLLFVEKLNDVDTTGVEPLIHMTDETNLLREDKIIPSITQQEALLNAPQKDTTYFRMPKVIE